MKWFAQACAWENARRAAPLVVVLTCCWAIPQVALAAASPRGRRRRAEVEGLARQRAVDERLLLPSGCGQHVVADEAKQH